jgi:hypothetical protein
MVLFASAFPVLLWVYAISRDKLSFQAAPAPSGGWRRPSMPLFLFSLVLPHPLMGKGACISTPQPGTHELLAQPSPLTSYKKASLQPDQAQEDVFGLSFCKSPAQSISKGAAGFILNAPHRNAVMFGVNNHSHVGRA